jgi:hypothetical protein
LSLNQNYVNQFSTVLNRIGIHPQPTEQRPIGNLQENPIDYIEQPEPGIGERRNFHEKTAQQTAGAFQHEPDLRQYTYDP